MSVHKFTVPETDTIVEKWIANQSNPGVSIRMLINLFVTEHGYQDVTCMAFGLAVKKRGRPSTQLKSKFEQFANGLNAGMHDQDDGYDYDEPEQIEETEEIPEPVQAPVSAPEPVRNVTKPAAKPVYQDEPAVDPDDIMLNMFNSPPSQVDVSGNTDDDGGEMDIDSLLG